MEPVGKRETPPGAPEVYEPPVLAGIGSFADETQGQWIGMEPDGSWGHHYTPPS
ncbi:lasso RiPP family leader peptide-containing protein [Streptomyces hoynatensis]|uniref:lasso RiPP family leader peptide-containing protein n=1 Tax=Streptomyces hoynatensis TaxID=1141874 RepID=UPI00131A1F91|nr:lasso RiPP family leader peptide-containing protein [Streptomyces hoynatensis]